MKTMIYIIAVVSLCFSTGFADLIDNGDGTVTDSVTHLMWTQATAKNVMNWENAVSYCESLEFAGYSDWRLPNVKELESIVDDKLSNPAVDKQFFPGTAGQGYWSSTTTVNSSLYAWCVNFYLGDIGTMSKGYSYGHVRAVRLCRQ